MNPVECICKRLKIISNLKLNKKKKKKKKIKRIKKKVENKKLESREGK